MDFDEFQRLSAETDLREDRSDFSIPLLGLAGEVGELVSEYKKRLRSESFYEGFEDAVKEELGDLLWYLSAVARTVGISLKDVAVQNLEKVHSAFDMELPEPILYDAGFPEHEQLPRQFAIFFSTEEVDGTERVIMEYEGEGVGDPIDDNAPVEDYYRYHDVFHLAHAAVLGWSPTLRSLLGRKRKSKADVDRIEDGGRSIAIEEGLSAFLFSEASEVSYFAGADRVGWDLLKTLRRMTSHLEVRSQPPIAWQSAVLQGYSVWREIRSRGGGMVEGDLMERRLTFSPK